MISDMVSVWLVHQPPLATESPNSKTRRVEGLGRGSIEGDRIEYWLISIRLRKRRTLWEGANK